MRYPAQLQQMQIVKQSARERDSNSKERICFLFQTNYDSCNSASFVNEECLNANMKKKQKICKTAGKLQKSECNIGENMCLIYRLIWMTNDLPFLENNCPTRTCKKIWKWAFLSSISIKTFLCVVYTNAGSRTKYLFKRRAEMLRLLSGRLDWTQVNVEHWQIWKYKKEDMVKINVTLISKRNAVELPMKS